MQSSRSQNHPLFNSSPSLSSFHLLHFAMYREILRGHTSSQLSTVGVRGPICMHPFADIFICLLRSRHISNPNPLARLARDRYPTTKQLHLIPNHPVLRVYSVRTEDFSGELVVPIHALSIWVLVHVHQDCRPHSFHPSVVIPSPHPLASCRHGRKPRLLMPL
jgi:hypothetical protein